MKLLFRRICISLLYKISHLVTSDRLYLKMMYYLQFGRSLDLNNPKTFNAKLQWLKLYNRNPEYIKMVDKYEAKKYVSSIIGDEYIIPTISVYSSVEEIDLEKLPMQFVLKCTHDSGGVVICKNKDSFDIKESFDKLRRGLKYNFYYANREWPYKYVKPRIIAEQYMEDKSTGELRDYKFFCFNGVVKFFKIDYDRFVNHHANYYSPNGDLLPFGEARISPIPNKQLSLPSRLYEMISFAEKLSENIPFLRVDFYEIDGHVYFGELTFFPDSGYGKWTSCEWDNKIGEYIDLDLVKKY